jgi:prepilin-type processing-associated H-X9-DG protein
LTGLSAVVGVVLLAVVLRVYVMPPPLENIAFSAAQTRVEEGAGEVVVQIQRTQDLQSDVRVNVAFVDGSAKTGEDYVAPVSGYAMKPAQAQLRLAIPILGDKTFRKGERSFDVVLENVAGRPRHTVVITPVAVSTSARVQLEQAVLNASRIAADIAGFVVKGETMEALLSEFRDRPRDFDEFRQQLKDVSDNLVRAREAYLQSVRVLQAQPPQQVLSVIEQLAADLRQRNFRQQSAVLPVMSRQLQELLAGKTPDMDRWVRELGQTVPRRPADGQQSPKV